MNPPAGSVRYARSAGIFACGFKRHPCRLKRVFKQALNDQAAAQQRAVTSARRAAELAGERHRAGIVSYLEVVDASRATLQPERILAQLAGQRLTAAVQLVKALGGGWTEHELLARSTVALRSETEERR